MHITASPKRTCQSSQVQSFSAGTSSDSHSLNTLWGGNPKPHKQKNAGPQPVYITGDFNVRFQAQHPGDEALWDLSFTVKVVLSLTTMPVETDLFVSKLCSPCTCARSRLSRHRVWNTNYQITTKRTRHHITGCNSSLILYHYSKPKQLVVPEAGEVGSFGRPNPNDSRRAGSCNGAGD